MSTRTRRATSVAGLCRSWLLVCSLALLCAAPVRAQELGVGVYAQGAREHHLMPQVVVRSPSAIPVRAEASYLIDVASRATIDLRSGERYESTRTHHELSARLGYDWGALRLYAHYRYVHRPDYISHTIDLPLAYSWTDWASSVALQPYVRLNEVLSPDRPEISRLNRMFGLRAVFQPWIDGRTLAQVAYELQYASGELSRVEFIGLGGPVPGSCNAAIFCLPERNPDSRLQHAARVLLRRALTESMSVGLSYRLFFDDWAMVSHTLEPDFSWLAWPGGLLRVRYRGYFQSATTAYENVQQLRRNASPPMYMTADALWSPLQTHRWSVDVSQTWTAAGSGVAFSTLLTLGVLRVAYENAYYDDVTALEGTLWLSLAI